MNLKFFKSLYLEGKIDKLPWEDYLAEKKTYMMKEDNRQVRKTTENPELAGPEVGKGYIQNEEQQKTGLWKSIRHKDE
jgi:hypothetical protein